MKELWNFHRKHENLYTEPVVSDINEEVLNEFEANPTISPRLQKVSDLIEENYGVSQLRENPDQPDYIPNFSDINIIDEFNTVPELDEITWYTA